jgi:pyruvate/oxaloacetate carboxyltransferase
MRLLTLFIFYIFISVRCLADPLIYSLEVFPASPTKNDTVRIALKVLSPGQGRLLHLTHQVQNNVIDVRGCYAILSGTSAGQFYEDTITIGMLPAGDYSINFTAYLAYDTLCTKADSSLKTAAFTVHAPAFIPTINPQSVTIYPNPAQNILHLHLTTGTTLQQAEIHDMQGRLLRSYHGKEPINVADLPKGLYMLLVETDRGRITKRFTKE